MKLQKNTSLALYSVLEIAADPTRHISGAEIASKYDVSSHHLAKVLSELARAGVVESVRGVGGGYRFTGNARRLTLMDIIQMFEDPGRPDPDRRDPGESTPVGRALGAVCSRSTRSRRRRSARSRSRRCCGSSNGIAPRAGPRRCAPCIGLTYQPSSLATPGAAVAREGESARRARAVGSAFDPKQPYLFLPSGWSRAGRESRKASKVFHAGTGGVYSGRGAYTECSTSCILCM